MNKIIPVVAIAVAVGIIAVVALSSTPSINYASMSCDELRDEVFYASSYLPTTNNEVKEQLENLRTILKIQEEKNCENMIIDGKKIVDESIKSALTFGKEPTEEQTQETATQESIYESISYTKNGVHNSMTQDLINEPRRVTLNSNSYTAGDVIEITVVFDRDLYAEFDDLSPDQEPDQEYVRMRIQNEIVSQTRNEIYYVNGGHYNTCELAKNYHRDGPNAGWTDVAFYSRDVPDSKWVPTEPDPEAILCTVNEDGSFSYMITLGDDDTIGNYRILGTHALVNYKPSFSWGPSTNNAIYHEVYSEIFEIVPRQ